VFSNLLQYTDCVYPKMIHVGTELTTNPINNRSIFSRLYKNPSNPHFVQIKMSAIITQQLHTTIFQTV